MKRHRFDDVFDAICDTLRKQKSQAARRPHAGTGTPNCRPEPAGGGRPARRDATADFRTRAGKSIFFALDKLVNMAARAGLDVTLKVQKREPAAA